MDTFLKPGVHDSFESLKVCDVAGGGSADRFAGICSSPGADLVHGRVLTTIMSIDDVYPGPFTAWHAPSDLDIAQLVAFCKFLELGQVGTVFYVDGAFRASIR